jgi:hypothetical protein
MVRVCLEAFGRRFIRQFFRDAPGHGCAFPQVPDVVSQITGTLDVAHGGIDPSAARAWKNNHLRSYRATAIIGLAERFLGLSRCKCCGKDERIEAASTGWRLALELFLSRSTTIGRHVGFGGIGDPNCLRLLTSVSRTQAEPMPARVDFR